LKNYFNDPSPDDKFSVVPGAYHFEAAFDQYYVAGRQGNATADLDFNTSLSHPNPPYLLDLRILADGKLAEVLPPRATKEIRWIIPESWGIRNVHLLLAPSGTSEWNDVPVEMVDPSPGIHSFSARLSSGLPGGFYSLRIQADDSSHNRLTYTLEPAFEIPGLSFTRLEASYGDVDLVCQRSVTTTVRNWDAQQPVHIDTAFSDNPAFTVSPNSGTVPGGDSLRFSLTFHPILEGNFTGNIVFVHDGNPLPDTIRVSGRGFSSGQSTVEVTSHLETGWQLISLPVRTCPYMLTHVFEYRSGYALTDSTVSGRGYWKKLTEPDMRFDGYPVVSESTLVDAHWNMIGSITGPVPVPAIATDPPNIINSSFFGYNGGYQISDTIQPGHGYWVRVLQQGKLIMNSSSAEASQQKHTALQDLLSRSNTLIFTDALGRTQQLYFFGHLPEDIRSADQFLLPPPPPEGAFDVRFGSGRMAEATELKTAQAFPILISGGARFPVSVHWTLLPGTSATLLPENGRQVPLTGAGSTIIQKQTSTIDLLVSPSGTAGIPKAFALEQNYPNPFNPSTLLNYALPVDSRVTLKVYNLLGAEVATLVDNEFQSAGYKSVQWNAADYPSGLYCYKLTAGGFTFVRKAILLK
jgi:hypothetical protein